MVFTNITPFPRTLTPVTNISPLTYRDAATFLEYLETIKQWLNETLVPDSNEMIANAIAEFQEGIANAEATVTATQGGWQGQWNDWTEEKAAEYAAYILSVNTAFETFKTNTNTIIDNAILDIAGEKGEWQTSFDAFMVDVESSLAALNDSAMAGLIGNRESNTAIALAETMPYVDLSNYGATGDGVTDDSLAFITGIAAASKVVLIPSGTFKISEIDLRSGITYRGMGAKATKLIVTSEAEQAFNLTGLSNIVMEDIAIEWNAVGTVAGYAHGMFKLDNSKNIVFRRCEFSVNNRSVFNLRRPTVATDYVLANEDITIDDCVVTVISGVTSYGVYCADRATLTDAGNQRIKIRDSEFIGGTAGILLDGDDCVISNNLLRDRVGSGIGTYKVYGLLIADNTSQDNTTQGIAIGNGTNDLAKNVIVRGNTCRRNGFQGIVNYKQGGDAGNTANTGLNEYVLIEGNFCYDNLVCGIFAYVNSRTIIRANHCYENVGAGILVSSKDDLTHGELILTDNKSHDNGGHGFGIGGPTIFREATVSGNHAKRNGQYGYDLNFVVDCVFSGNHAYDNQFSGFRFRNGTTGIVSQNIAKRNNVAAGANYDIQFDSFDMRVLFNICTTSNLTIGSGPTACVGNSWVNMFKPGDTVEFKGSQIDIAGYVGKFSLGYRRHATGTAAPTTGDWLKGDRMYNTSPNAGGFEGWICVANGTPGTWKGYGAIEA